MLKKSHFLIAIIIGASFICGGCQKEEPINAQNVLILAMQKVNQAEQYEVNRNINIEIETKENESLNMNIHEDLKAQKVPNEIYKSIIANEITVGDETQVFNAEQYMEKLDEERYVVYSKLDDTWDQETVYNNKMSEVVFIPINDMCEALAKNGEVNCVGDATIDGVDCYALEVKINTEQLIPIIMEAGIFNSIGIDEAGMQYLSDDEERVCKLYVNKENGELIRWYFDLSKTIEEALMKEYDITNDQLDKFSFVIESSYNYIVENDKIILPQEVTIQKEKKNK